MAKNSFLGVFAQSPLKPLEEHINVVCECSQQLPAFFRAVFQQDWAEAKHVYQLINSLEKRADDIKRNLRSSLPNGIFLPINRQDLLQLLTVQDKIANLSKDIAGRVLGRELVIPDAIQSSFMTYVERCLDATEQARVLINEMDDLLETGFSGREAKLAEAMIDKLDEIEDDTDDLQIALRASLKSLESTMNPIDVMFLYKVFESVGGLADVAERAGARLELMLAK
ncbi:TIGR00153 family protein [Aestuariibacter salexigens]|uniref:TIGR00153 family protein n=1 Tax=Aestuariibacter salexigens TaxID=226010 RepID=UPI00041B1642|nr:TIGR00153 family protein [Aestuariibacter salexigens]